MIAAHAKAAAPSGASSSPFAALRIRDLHVSFPSPDGRRVPAVQGVSLSVYPGQALALVGESGSGKTVTALCVPRLLAAPPASIDRGAVLVDAGEAAPIDTLRADAAQLRRIRGRAVAMVFQEPMTSLNPAMRIGDQIAEGARAHDMSRRDALAAAHQALADVGFSDPRAQMRQFPHQLSGGMRQRALLAIALACRPRTLIADEPTTALDSTTQARALALIDDARARSGMALLLITHSLALARSRADVVCVMWRGRIVEYGSASDVLARPHHPYTRALLAAQPALHAPAPRLGVDRVERTPIEAANDAFAWTPDEPPGECRLLPVGSRRWVGVCADPAEARPEPPDLPPPPASQ